MTSINTEIPSVIEIKQLNIDMIEPTTQRFSSGDLKKGGSKIVVIGKPGTGKSTLMADIMYKKKHIFPIAMVQSGTEELSPFYENFIPKTFIYNSYDETALEKFIERQTMAKKYLANPWALLCLDDFCDNPSELRKPIQNKLFKTGRQKAMLYLAGFQVVVDIPPSLRACIDGVFILREPSVVIRKKLYDNFGGIIPDFSLFCSLMDSLTDDFCAMYIHNATSSNQWRECVFWYKAEEPPKGWRFGCDEYWDFHNQRYEEENDNM